MGRCVLFGIWQRRSPCEAFITVIIYGAHSWYFGGSCRLFSPYCHAYANSETDSHSYPDTFGDAGMGTGGRLGQRRVYAGIDVAVTLDDRKADEITSPAPAIEYVFLDVAPGMHVLNVRDVVGYSETREVEVPTSNSTGELPDWVDELIERLQHEPVTNPPALVLQYEYKGESVYFVPQRCCDIFSDLYDSNGNVIAHPDGGITGQGDGRAPDFFQERTGEKLLWSDKREYDPALTQVLAPIESVEILILESYPVQYRLKVVSGLPNGCTEFGGYQVDRDGEPIRVEMVNWKPADESTACTQEYRTVDTHIHLGSDFQSGETYTVEVNGTIVTFIAQ
jgi:hypothetical protein